MRNIDQLIAQGYIQVSRRYRIVARLPEGKTGLEALREVDPRLVQEMLDRVERDATDMYLRVHATPAEKLNLSETEFEAFLERKNR